jgi:predicted nuclease with RNAse H fold
MLYGFEIFKALRANGAREVIEVYPYAIVRSLLPECPHKTTPDGYGRQLESVAAATINQSISMCTFIWPHLRDGSW